MAKRKQDKGKVITQNLEIRWVVNIIKKEIEDKDNGRII